MFLHLSPFLLWSFTYLYSSNMFFYVLLLFANIIISRNINKYVYDLLWEFSPPWKGQKQFLSHNHNSQWRYKVQFHQSPSWGTNQWVYWAYLLSMVEKVHTRVLILWWFESKWPPMSHGEALLRGVALLNYVIVTFCCLLIWMENTQLFLQHHVCLHPPCFLPWW